MKKAFLFDMDGTLIDSMKFWANLKFMIGELYEKRCGEKVFLSPEEMERLEGMGLPDAIKYINEIKGTSISFRLDCYNSMAEFYEKECEIKPSVLKTLQSLRERGHKMAVCTATPKALAEIALKKQGILEYFDFILTPEQVKGGKFHRPIFWVAALKFKRLPKDVVLVDDAAYALKTAKRAGCKAIAVFDQYRAEPLGDAGDIRFENFGGIYEYLLSGKDFFK